MSTTRRYDIDWLRVIAIGLLLIYHVAIGFQPWGVLIGFITNTKPWGSLWIPMSILNLWRIPLLFFVSGMGVYFAIQNRDWKELIRERAMRILLPFVFGSFFIFPVSTLLWQYHYHLQLNYDYHPGHLWFLGNIFVYVIILTPVFFYLKRNENGKIVNTIKSALSHPLGLLPVTLVLIAEVVIVEPISFALYAMTWHGFILGFLAFFFGFCIVIGGDACWAMLLKWRWVFFTIALLLSTYRLFQPQMNVANYLLVIESNAWIFSIFGFGYKYLNHSGKILTYLSQAAYPIYILHMIFLSLGSMIIFPLAVDVYLQFVLVLAFTLTGCLVSYEFIVRRTNFLRPLFGLKWKSSRQDSSTQK